MENSSTVNPSIDQNVDLDHLLHQMKCDLIRVEGARRAADRKLQTQIDLLTCEHFPMNQKNLYWDCVDLRHKDTMRRAAEIKERLPKLRELYVHYKTKSGLAVEELLKKLSTLEVILQREYDETFETTTQDLRMAVSSLRMTRPFRFLNSLHYVESTLDRLKEIDGNNLLQIKDISRGIKDLHSTLHPGYKQKCPILDLTADEAIKLLADLKDQVGEMKFEPSKESEYQSIKSIEATLAELKLEQANLSKAISDMEQSKMNEYHQMFMELSSNVAEAKASLEEVKASISNVQLVNTTATTAVGPQTETLQAIGFVQKLLIAQGESLKKNCYSNANKVAGSTLEGFKQINGTLETLKMEVEKISNTEDQTEEDLNNTRPYQYTK